MDNLLDVVIDEVALEGLDGITFEGKFLTKIFNKIFQFSCLAFSALQTRLATRLEKELPFGVGFIQQLWDIITKIKGFAFYQLETPRPMLVVTEMYEVSNRNFCFIIPSI